MIELEGKNRYEFMGRKVRTSRGIGRLVGYRFDEETSAWGWVVKLDKDSYLRSLAPGEDPGTLQVGRVIHSPGGETDLVIEEET